jgi:hypothetical protein
MRTYLPAIIIGLVLISPPALAQNTPPAGTSSNAAAGSKWVTSLKGQWLASKLKGRVELLVSQFLERIAVLDLVLAGNHAPKFKDVGAGSRYRHLFVPRSPSASRCHCPKVTLKQFASAPMGKPLFDLAVIVKISGGQKRGLQSGPSLQCRTPSPSP